MRSGVKERSRAAVAAAGSRERGAASKSSGYWTVTRGKRADGPWRPGKTAHKRKGSRA